MVLYSHFNPQEIFVCFFLLYRSQNTFLIKLIPGYFVSSVFKNSISLSFSHYTLKPIHAGM